ncbi:MAG: hypothetical protein EXS36_10620 [Pedosphaera sp.]|nr:hypothetical protein [Pedosphaera sp.]
MNTTLTSKIAERRTRHVSHCRAAAILLLLISSSLHAALEISPWVPVFTGIDRAAATNKPPTSQFSSLFVAYALRVDLKAPGIRLFITPKAAKYVLNSAETLGQNVSDFLKTHQLQAAVNGGRFDPAEYYPPAGTRLDVHGLVVSDGEIVSPQDTSSDSAVIAFSEKNEPVIIQKNWPATNTAGIFSAIAGTYPLVSNGALVANLNNQSGFINGVNPRTAAGISKDRQYLYLIVIDGRQNGYSIGALNSETAGLMILLGAHEAINLDGGGSTTMVLADSTGRPQRVNRSSAVADSGRERIVGSHLGIYALPLVGFLDNIRVQPDDTAATVTWTTASPATSAVQYGIDEQLIASTSPNSTLVTQHAVRITGLSPDTGYYFRVNSSASGVNQVSTTQYFTTTNYFVSRMLSEIEDSWRYSVGPFTDSAWALSTFDDSSWTEGPGLLWTDVRSTGPNPDVMPRGAEMPASPMRGGFPFQAYYFRKHFNLSQVIPGTSLGVTAFVDDGAVIYLNGKEAYRLRMEAAPAVIEPVSLAIGFPCDGDATCTDQFTIAGEGADSLVAGDNVIAVEVHNYNPSSPDITFGIALEERITLSPPVVLGLANGLSGVTLSWERPGFVLEESPNAGGPWTQVPGPVVSSPFKTLPGTGNRFFRLRR